jgi:hypothetical protein
MVKYKPLYHQLVLHSIRAVRPRIKHCTRSEKQNIKSRNKISTFKTIHIRNNKNNNNFNGIKLIKWTTTTHKKRAYTTKAGSIYTNVPKNSTEFADLFVGDHNGDLLVLRRLR